MLAFLLLVGAGLRIAQTARSDFSKLVATGLTIIVGFQAFFIMAGVLRLLPLTGITLPFVAYGGSSLVANYVLIALLMRISEEGTSTTRRAGHGDEPARGVDLHRGQLIPGPIAPYPGPGRTSPSPSSSRSSASTGAGTGWRRARVRPSLGRHDMTSRPRADMRSSSAR